jgi:hypothetical protein
VAERCIAVTYDLEEFFSPNTIIIFSIPEDLKQVAGPYKLINSRIAYEPDLDGICVCAVADSDTYYDYYY